MPLLVFLVGGAALEVQMQHFVLQNGKCCSHCEFPEASLSKLSWWVAWVCGCMAGGEQCASTSELWSVCEVMSQCGVFWLCW